MSRRIGNDRELEAKLYLEQQGLIFVTNNFRSKFGEIDLIMQEQGYVVFIEVRARESADYGGALFSITRSKQHKLIKTAQYYLWRNPHARTYPCRFDVLCFEGKEKEVLWIKNAFDAA